MVRLELPRHPFTRADIAPWVTDWHFRRMLDEGQIRRVIGGAYVDASAPDTIELRAQAATLVTSSHAVLCDRTAAWLHGVDVLLHRELEVLPRLEVFVLRGHHRVERPQVHGGQRDLAAGDIMEVHGVRVTTPLRTALDLACKLPRYPAMAALDAFANRFGLTREQLQGELDRRYRRRRGVVQARQLVPHVDARAESPRESWLRLAIVDANLPAPEPQVWVFEHGRPVFRLDLAYPRSMIAVEYDGAEFHDATNEQREADLRRREWLRERGWTVIVVTKRGLTDEGRSEWLPHLRSALRVAA